ncbi:MAG: DMT family transporter [Granulosicoccaceae bacterium]
MAGFIGALLIIQPGSDTFSWASFLPLGSALFYAAYIATTRAYSNIDHPVAMQFASGLGATIILTMALLITNTWEGSHFAPSVPTGEQWLWLLAVGFIAASGHLLVVMAVSRAPASLLAPLGYVEIIAATLLGWMVFDEWPDALSWMGIAVIVASGIYVFERERRVATI